MIAWGYTFHQFGQLNITTLLVNYGASMAVLVQYYFTFKETLYALHFSDGMKSQKQ
jgi:hypothetical protein